MSVPRFSAADRIPGDVPVLGVPVYADLSTPAGAGAELSSSYLAQRRFEGKPGQAQALMADDGSTVVALGVGTAGSVDADVLRRAGAALARHAGNASEVATTLPLAAGDPDQAAAIVEGMGLGAYRYASAPSRTDRDRCFEHATLV